MTRTFKNDWQDILADEFKKDYYLELQDFLEGEYERGEVYPRREDIFRALDLTAYRDVKAVILGQDPYHGPGQALGFSFAVREGLTLPPSLRNIYKELEADLGYPMANHGNLEKWARQGVLLLNTVLTVRAKSPNSHRGRGWETFTDRIIGALNQREEPVVFILWGRNAQEKEALITRDHHCLIKSFHPSPFSASRGFFGSRPFSRTNDFLSSQAREPIDWQIENI